MNDLTPTKDHFETECMDIFNRAGANPDAPVTFDDFGRLLKALAAFMADHSDAISEVQQAMTGVATAWRTLGEEIGVSEEGHVLPRDE